ncbi:MAG: hypothetical protein V1880_04815 [Patescibacteria group bacterium]
MSQGSFDLLQTLEALDVQAERMGAEKIRRSIADAIDDLPEPEGKSNARKAIREVREALKKFKSTMRAPRISSVSSVPPSNHSDLLDDVPA